MLKLLACLLLVPGIVCAGEIRKSSIALAGGVYRIMVDAHIDAPPDTVHRRITDYDNLSRINHSIRESRVLQTFSPDRHRVHSDITACILFFCRHVTQVQDIVQHGRRRVEASILPELSDFRYGHAVWLLEADGPNTLMHFTAQLEPSFWVPPLIGPWLFENKIVSELLESARIIEADWRGQAVP
ncbi:MAG: SRPBCC family protein [Gammaproteobacteria bacterium]